MRILTVRQPWASAIISGAKTVENRPTNIAGAYRGPIAVHAGRREDLGARSHPQVTRWAREYWGTEPVALFTGDRTKFGHIIGVVDLIDVHHATRSNHPNRGGAPICWDNETPIGRLCSPWADVMHDGWHLRLANPRPLVEPIPYRGALGLRNLAVNDPTTTARILAQIGNAE